MPKCSADGESVCVSYLSLHRRRPPKLEVETTMSTCYLTQWLRIKRGRGFTACFWLTGPHGVGLKQLAGAQAGPGLEGALPRWLPDTAVGGRPRFLDMRTSP